MQRYKVLIETFYYKFLTDVVVLRRNSFITWWLQSFSLPVQSQQQHWRKMGRWQQQLWVNCFSQFSLSLVLKSHPRFRFLDFSAFSSTLLGRTLRSGTGEANHQPLNQLKFEPIWQTNSKKSTSTCRNDRQRSCWKDDFCDTFYLLKLLWNWRLCCFWKAVHFCTCSRFLENRVF